jgi:PAS domain S-box-containing protein
MQQQTDLRCVLEAKLEMAEEALAHSNCNIQLTMQILIQASKEIEPLLAERAANIARISSLVQQIREQVQSEDERQILDAASPHSTCAHNYVESLHQMIDGQRSIESGVAMAELMLPFIFDNTSWRAYVEFLRAQMGLVELKDEAKQELTNRTHELVRANQQLKSIVAERKRVEERLSQLESIIELADDAITIHTLGGTIVSWNAGAESVYGYSASEVLGRSRYILVPQDQMDEASRILKGLERGEKIPIHETVNIRKDGRRINVSISVSPVRDPNGNIVGAATITRELRN